MSMENILMRTYATFTKAEDARSALLAAGFPPDAIQFTAKDDEAGPVAGSFVIDRESDPNSDRRTPDFSEGYDPNEVQSTQPVDWGRSYLLMVDAQDRERLKIATDITEQFGGIDTEQVIRSGTGGA